MSFFNFCSVGESKQGFKKKLLLRLWEIVRCKFSPFGGHLKTNNQVVEKKIKRQDSSAVKVKTFAVTLLSITTL